MKNILTKLLLGATIAASPAVVRADAAKIRTVDGSLAMSGEVIAFDDEFLELQTTIGVIKIDRSLAICEGVGCPPAPRVGGTVTIAGSESIGNDILLNMIERYSQTNDLELQLGVDPASGTLNADFKSDDGGEHGSVSMKLAKTEDAFESLLSGEASLILSSRPAEESEAARFREAGFGDIRDSSREVVVALDGLALIVSEESPITSISLTQAADIFSGQTTNWSELGGPDAAIVPYLPSRDEEAFSAFNTEVLRTRRLRPGRNVNSEFAAADISGKVAESPFAIGVTTLAKNTNARALPIRLECGLFAEPDGFAVQSEEYPLTRRVFMYSNQNIDQIGSDLLDFVKSDRGQAGLNEVGMIDQRISERTVNELGLRFMSAFVSTADSGVDELRAMANEVLFAKRLSTALRFNSGSSTLDSKAESDIQRLVDLFRSDQFTGKEILLLGFTDNVGRADINQILSNSRAEQVRDSILASADGAISAQQIRTIGYGPIAPVGCNTNPQGRAANRRVEVWVRG